jgi:hypothetical protein
MKILVDPGSHCCYDACIMSKDVFRLGHNSEFRTQAYISARHFLDTFLLPRLEEGSVTSAKDVEALSYVYLQNNPQFIDSFHLICPLRLAFYRLQYSDQTSFRVQQAHDLLADVLFGE